MSRESIMQGAQKVWVHTYRKPHRGDHPRLGPAKGNFNNKRFTLRGCRGDEQRRENHMNMQEEAVKKITNELWNDNLWFRKLDEEGQKTIATTVAMIRMNRIKGMRKFAEVMNVELKAILANISSFGITERQEVKP
jgi:hypothetical protein